MAPYRKGVRRGAAPWTGNNSGDPLEAGNPLKNKNFGRIVMTTLAICLAILVIWLLIAKSGLAHHDTPSPTHSRVLLPGPLPPSV